ncbi:MAG: TniQ family protein [Pyrinomonadaceae bacterium]
MGIETPYMESLTGYVARLAESHNVSTGQLFAKELVPKLNRHYLTAKGQRQDSQILFRIRKFIQAVNGTKKIATDFVVALERLTLQKNLKYLTLLPWKEVISTRFLLRLKRAWCPQCFYEDKESSGIVYEHLLWAIKFVIVCVKHKLPLISICPFCNKESSVLTPKARPGHCYRCGRWLGAKFETTICDSPAQTINYETELQVSSIVGELLVLTSKSKKTVKNEIFNYNFLYCAQSTTNNKLNAFGRFLEVEGSLIHKLAKKKRHVQLDSLTKIVKNLNIPVEMLFLQKLPAQCVLPKIQFPRKLDRNDKLKILNKALIDPQTPSLDDLAQEHGISSTTVLRRANAELCKQITARNRSANPRKRPPLKKHDTEAIEKELYLALKETPPPFLRIVAERLGYTNGAAVRNRCPELSKQLVEKHSRYLKELNKKLEESLIKTLSDFPPLPLQTIAKRLGYKDPSGFSERFPELCRAISIRFKKYNPRFEIVSKALQIALTENPPPTLESISKSLNVCSSFLYKCNSEICYQISERYRQFTKNMSLQRRKERHEMIRKIVLDLHSKGIYPSRDKVSHLLTSSFNRVHDLAFLIELRKSLGIN